VSVTGNAGTVSMRMNATKNERENMKKTTWKDLEKEFEREEKARDQTLRKLTDLEANFDLLK